MASLNTRGARMGTMQHFLLWKLGLKKAWSFHNQEELACLQRHAQHKRYLAELGIWQGVSTCHIRQGMMQDATLFAVDPFPPGRLGFNEAEVIAHTEVSKISNGHVEWLKMEDQRSADEITSRKLALDFIFSDALTTYQGLTGIWTKWKPLLAKHGVFIISTSRSRDDLKIDNEESVKFTNEILHRDEDLECIDTAGTLTVFRKR